MKINKNLSNNLDLLNNLKKFNKDDLLNKFKDIQKSEDKFEPGWLNI